MKAAVGWASSCKLGQEDGNGKASYRGGATALPACSSPTIILLICGYMTSHADNPAVNLNRRMTSLCGRMSTSTDNGHIREV